MSRTRAWTLLALTAFWPLAGSRPVELLAGAREPNLGSNPPELGVVRWERDLDRGLAESRQDRKPALILFQEIPGCGTCVGFGRQVLSHPLLVEAIETEFVPIAIHNNRGGRDREVLARFSEPAWNNPVLRFVDGGGRDVVPRRDGLYSPHQVAKRLIEALAAAGRPIPDYLELARDETHLAAFEPAAFGMHCYWQGEAKLGAIAGVVATRAVWREGGEAVEVMFDRDALSYRELVRKASAAGCAARVFTRDDDQHRTARALVGERAVRGAGSGRSASGSDQKHSLERSPLRLLPLTPMQATRVNAALALGTDPQRWLSPRQRGLVRTIERALAADPNRLAGLARPETVEDLAAYETRLRARL
ncbi:MAG TPA: VPGUxxT family thioredoxin-like (seleno)protein, type 2 [Candidatus Limnocylindria bacterium]|nr:VPGUxxT family thioredoxin-like (seleno)protein, type 2 [Candidatus Limnocylindria bacterium]